MGDCVGFENESDDVTEEACSSDSADGIVISKVSDPIDCEPTTEQYVVTSESGSDDSYYCIDNTNHPASWDPALVDLAEEVERLRGLDFLYPVELVALDDEAFDEHFRQLNEEITTDSPGTTVESEERTADNEEYVGRLRALGLMSGDLPELDYDDPNAIGVVGYFDSYTEDLVVRSDVPDVAYRATVIHELVHALQHQHFGLNRSHPTNEAWLGWQGLVEGDARRIERYWFGTLREEELAEFDEYVGEIEADSDMPPFVLVEIESPYAFGAPAVDLIDSVSGVEAVNALFEDPPTSSMLLTNPLLAAEHVVATIKPPPTPDDAEILGEGEFGPLLMWQILAGRIDHNLTHDAIDAWSAGLTVDYRSGDGEICVAGRIMSATPAGNLTIGSALEAWADAVGFPVSVSAGDDEVEFVSCDPGPDGPTPEAALAEPSFWAPALELDLASTVIYDASHDFTDEEAQCVLDGVRDVLTLEERSNPDLVDEARLEVFNLLALGCISG